MQLLMLFIAFTIAANFSFSQEIVEIAPTANSTTTLMSAPNPGIIAPTIISSYNYNDLELGETFQVDSDSYGYGTQVKIIIGHPTDNATYGETLLVTTTTFFTNSNGDVVGEQLTFGTSYGVPVNIGPNTIISTSLPERQLASVSALTETRGDYTYTMTKTFDVNFEFDPDQNSTFCPPAAPIEVHRSIVFNVIKIHKIEFGIDIENGELASAQFIDGNSLGTGVNFGNVSTDSNGVGGELLTWSNANDSTKDRDYTPDDPNNSFDSWQLEGIWTRANHLFT